MNCHQMNILPFSPSIFLYRFAGIVFVLLTCLFLTTSSYSLELPDIVMVQMPADAGSFQKKTDTGLPGRYINNCSIVRYSPQSPTKGLVNLTPSFASAMDPSVSFDGKTILFSGKKAQDSPWHIFQMNTDGTRVVQITKGENDHVSPLYVGTLFYLNDKVPTGQIIYGQKIPSQNKRYAIFASNRDGSKPRQVSFNLYSDFDPDVLPNGRMVFSSNGLKRQTGPYPASRLLAANIDGTDLMPFTGDQAISKQQLMPRAGFDRRLYYIESDSLEYLSGGMVASVSQFRSLHSLQQISQMDEGRFHSPCPLPNGQLLISFRKDISESRYGIYILNPLDTARLELIYASEKFHYVDTQLILPRNQARGRSSVVGFKYKDSGVFFCMDVYNTDRTWIRRNVPKGSVKSVLITQGNINATGTVIHKVIGTAPVESDGSFHVRVPAEVPITFHLLDANGLSVARQESWTWVMHGENRGCIGCHEDRELSPPNHFIEAVQKKEVKLLPAHDQRPAINFVEQVYPILKTKCSPCHAKHNHPLSYEDPAVAFKIITQGDDPYVLPFETSKSPLILSLFGLLESAHHPGLKFCNARLSPVEKKAFADWVNTGASFSANSNATLQE